MVFGHSRQSPDRRILHGQLCFVAAILLQHFGPRLPGLAGNDFWAGLMDGLSVVLLGLSIILNVTGARAMRSKAGR
jgi:hypothetical protein